MNAIFQLPKPINEPILSYAPGSAERAALKRALANAKSSVKDIPMIIGGQEVRTGNLKSVNPPHEHKHVLAQFHQGDAGHVEQAINSALHAKKDWESLSWDQRAAIFLKAADLLAGPYRPIINAATMLGQSKNAYQAEIDSACELIDFLRFNASFAEQIYTQQSISAPGQWNRMEYRALEGFVFALTPFNFTAIAGNLPSAPALMGNTVVWKPANTQIFAAQPRSYRDLPVRLAEFGTVYRYEQSGELSGMTRVRGFTQDDAHLFCTADQVRDEFRATMELTQFVLKSLGLNDYKLRLSKHDPSDPKYAGAAGDLWRQAEEDIRSVLLEMALPFEEAPGEAAFYGPKADFIVRDCLGRQWQLGTVQLDYVLPERFGLTYTGADNAPHRPVMIHRAPFGSMERFMGILIEHFAGAFPLWLAPEQVRVLPISEKFNEYAQKVVSELKSAGLRAEVDLRAEKIGAKIRNAQIEKIPVMLVVGAKEAEDGTVSYRDRLDGDQGAIPLADALARIKQESESRAIRQTVEPLAPVSPADDHTTEDHTY